ncbi:DUF3757 domain-containing protein [Trinickia symbiotica]
MKKTIFVFTLTLGASCYASAETVESCPNVETIHRQGSIYTAATSGAEGSWWGVAENDDDGDDIRRFSSAIFYPAQDSESRALVNCSYKLGNGDYADLRFITGPPRPALGVQEGIWLRKHDPDGHSYYECNELSPLSCIFYVIRRP